MRINLLKAAGACALFFIPLFSFAQAPTLGTTANFVLFTSNGAVSNTGMSHLTGHVGTNSGSNTGFGNVNGQMHSGDGVTTTAAADLLIAYNQLNSTVPTAFPAPLLGNGQSLNAGVYSIAAPATLNNTLTLNGQGNSNAVFIFQIQGSLSAASLSKVSLINGAKACNVFWKVEGLVSLAPGATMRGTIVANNAAIVMNANVTLEGRALSTTGAVTTDKVLAYTPTGCGSPVLTGPAAPALATTANYAILSGNGPVTNSGITTITGDVGTNVGLTTGFDPLRVTGMIHPIPDGSTAAAASDLLNVYNYLNLLPVDIELLYPAQFGHNLVLTPHTYLMSGAATFTDTLILNAQGVTNAVFVIKINGALSTSTFSNVMLINGAQAKNVYWKVDGAVQISDFSEFKGTLVVNNGAIDLTTGAQVDGRVLTTDGAINTAAVTVKIQSTVVTPSEPTWTGATSAAWNVASNWSPSGVPAATATVTIPDVTIQPVISSGTVSVKNIIVQNDAALTITGGTVNVSGYITNNGTLMQSGGTTVLNGTANQAIGGTEPITFYNLTVGSQGATLNTEVNMVQVLSLTGTLTTKGNLNLLSNAAGTAMLVNNPGVTSGTILMERYITGSVNSGNGYRHFSSPVSNATISALQTNGFMPVVNPAYNTASNPAAVTPFPNVLLYNQNRIVSTNAATSDFGYGWMSPTVLSNVLTPGKGYSVNINASSKVDLRGTANNGTVTVTNLNNGGLAHSGWHLLGNPYPSPIDWDLITKPTGMYPSVYVIRSTSAFAGNWIGYVNGVGGITNGILPAMQGFMVQTTTNVPSFSFTNAARVTSYANPSFFRTAAETRPVLKLNLNNGLLNEDETYVYLENGATAQFEGHMDAVKIAGGNATLHTMAGTDALSVNGLGTVSNQQIPLVITGAAGSLTLAAGSMVNFTTYDVVLEDKVSNTFTNLAGNTNYNFSHAGGTVANRFVIHINAKINSVKDAVNGMAVNVYPNPNNGEFTVQLSGLKAEKAELTVSDVVGRKVLGKSLQLNGTSFAEKLQLPNAKGIYMLQVKTATQTITRKIVVE